MEKTTFHLSVIGELGIHENRSCIILKPEMSPGLKFLSLYSHVLVFYRTQDELFERVASIDEVDMAHGLVFCTFAFPSMMQGSVYDLKPYFPCEDRVKNATYAGDSSPVSLPLVKDTLSCIGSVVREEGKFKIVVESTALLDSLYFCSHVKILWWFDKFDKPEYRRTLQCNPPYEHAPRTGVFASRSPVRPNPLALTTAKILHIQNNEVFVSMLDCFDGTPVLGLLAYDPREDCIDSIRTPAWLAHWPEHVNDTEYKDGHIALVDSPLRSLLTKSTLNHDWLHAESRVQGKREALVVRGARQNNLKNIEISIPYGKITTLTGKSGSGKSSLAFDTIYTECKRRFLDVSNDNLVLTKPDFDSFDGALPVVSVSQRSLKRTSRSTVGTLLGSTDLLRVLFSSIGVRHCPDCGNEIIPMTKEEIIGFLSPFSPVQIWDGEANPCDDVHTALKRGKGVCVASVAGLEPIRFQTHEACSHCGRIMFTLSPSLFSPTNPEARCPVCNGLGVQWEVDVDAIVTFPEKSLLDGASPWYGNLRSFKKSPNANWMKGEVFALAKERQVDLEKPWKELPEEFKHEVLYGSNGRVVVLNLENSKIGRNGTITRPVEGACTCIKRLFTEQKGATITQSFMKQTTCSYCQGERLDREGRMVTVAGKRFPQMMEMSLSQLKSWCEDVPSLLTDKEVGFALPLLQKLHNILLRCMELGVGYLTSNRNSDQISGGELQRLKLISQLGEDICGVLYVLDEPTSGLHPRDYQQLIKAIQMLNEKGNTILLVEHNRDLIALSDKVIDLGPGAGDHGGFVIADGSLKEVAMKPESETGRYLSGTLRVNLASACSSIPGFVEVKGASLHNVNDVSIAFPKGRITCITGVSGSGKSSLLEGVVYPSVESGRPVHCTSVSGAGFSKVVMVDQLPIGRNPRSIPATYMGIMDSIREVFAHQSTLGIGSFSFNTAEGWCENCHGEGVLKAEFMEDVWVTCPVCGGKRYKKEVLEVRYQEKNIHEVLNLSVEDACLFFSDVPSVKTLLSALCDVGLEYLKLGQNTMTLSGGEAQRLKLAKNLGGADKKNVLYILDEPTNGLHCSDIQHLLQVLRHLSDEGNTIVMVEHSMDVIKNADWIIDLGPEGGEQGGTLIAQGSPEEIEQVAESFTGGILRASHGTAFYG